MDTPASTNTPNAESLLEHINFGLAATEVVVADSSCGEEEEDQQWDTAYVYLEPHAALGKKFIKKDGMYFSSLTELSLSNFTASKQAIYESQHKQECHRCSDILKWQMKLKERTLSN